MTLENFGFETWATLREITRDDRGEVVCTVAEIPIEYSRGQLHVPVARLADDDLRDALEDAGVEYVRSRGYESPSEDVLYPETVGGPEAHGYSSQVVGVRAEFTDGHAWIPVRSDDLEAADDALEAAHDPTASADGGGAAAATAGASETPDADSGRVRPESVAELGLPTEYPDGHPRYTYVGHCKADDVDVYAGRHGDDGEHHLISVEEPGEAGWLGNPYPEADFGREESVDMFMRSFFLALEQRPELVDAVYNLRGKVLGCWCHRLEDTGDDHPVCHADVIAKVADRVIKRRTDAENGGGRGA